MKTSTTIARKLLVRHLALSAMLTSLVCLCASNSGYAYETYASGCNSSSCHGAFDGSTSPKGTTFPSGDKHVMHNGNNNMNTDCYLCHWSIGDDPFMSSSKGTGSTAGLGCAGCHVGVGLRAHHAANGITTCYTAECHDPGETPEENVINPPYYGSPDTEADNACNDVLSANINENWSIGDFLGLDNDGDNLYDLADYSCGPFRVVEVVPEGNDLRVRWETAGGRTERVQATTVLTNGFSDVDSPVAVSGVGIVTQEVVLINGAVGPVGFYQVRSAP